MELQSDKVRSQLKFTKRHVKVVSALIRLKEQGEIHANGIVDIAKETYHISSSERNITATEFANFFFL